MVDLERWLEKCDNYQVASVLINIIEYLAVDPKSNLLDDGEEYAREALDSKMYEQNAFKNIATHRYDIILRIINNEMDLLMSRKQREPSK